MYRFDLDKAISTWRETLSRDSALLDDDLDELESHLRAHIARLTREGAPQEHAFERASKRLGAQADIEAEYRKIRIGRSKRRVSIVSAAGRSTIMLRNYALVGVRSIRRNLGYSAINIIGLAVGIACSIVIFLFVRNELAVNDVFADAERIHRVGSDWAKADMGLDITTLAPVGETLVREYPEVADHVRMYLMSGELRIGDKGYRREIMMADPSVIGMFDLPLLRGDPDTALSAPRSAVVTENLANDLFGTIDVLGRTILLRTWQRGEQPYTITAIRKTLPYNSITYFGAEKDRHEVIISPTPFGDFFAEEGWTAWGSRYILQYVKLSPGASVAGLRSKLGNFVEAYAPADFHGVLKIRLDPLQTLYLEEDNGKVWRLIRLLGLVAVLILILATINFINLSTARSLTRAREVGVRKAIGAHRSQLTLQFMSESILTCGISSLIGVGLAAACLSPAFRFAGRDRVLESIWDPVTLVAVVAITLITGIIAGLYPALVLSSFRPVEAMKNSLYFGRGGGHLRRGLVFVQFAVAVILLVSVVVVSRQLSFVSTKDLGFDTENILVIDSVPREFNDEGVARMRTVRSRLAAIPGVASASLSWRTAAEGGDSRAMYPPDAPATEAISVPAAIVDGNFARTYGLRIKEGRFFREHNEGIEEGIVLNESAARIFGWNDGIDGKSLVAWPTARALADADPPPPRPVIGVLEDYHFESLHNPIGPLAFFSVDSNPMYRVMSIRISSGDVRSTLARVRFVWEEMLPGAPFEFTFVDDHVARAYRSETQMRNLVSVAAGLSMLIACLGMLGLASISSIQRTKETGIRKVMGATVAQLVVLLSTDFLKPVVPAVLVGCPLGYVIMRSWLADYAYRIELTPTLFFPVAGAGLAIAFFTVSYHAVKTALSNPTESLRAE